MTDFNKNSSAILSELAAVMDGVDGADAERLASAIASAGAVFTAGCGRSGLMAKAFAMRLMHLGCRAYVVGETTAPAIGRGDLLIVCSGKGEKRSLIWFMEDSAKAGARCAAVTAAPASPVARLAETVVVLPAAGTRQFGGSLFEQALLIFFDSLVIRLAELRGATHAQMAARHANLE